MKFNKEINIEKKNQKDGIRNILSIYFLLNNKIKSDKDQLIITFAIVFWIYIRNVSTYTTYSYMA